MSAQPPHDLPVALGSAIESITEGVALFDAQDRLLTFNERYRELLNASKAFLRPGIRFIDIVQEQIRGGRVPEADGRAEAFLEQRIKDHLNPQEPFELELGDGRWVRVQERKTADGGVIAVLTEITERKRREERLRDQAEELERFNAELLRENKLREATEASLRESEARARAIFEAAVDGVITYDARGVIESVNPAIERMFGYSSEELAGQNVGLLMDGGQCAEGGGGPAREAAETLAGGLHMIQGIRKDGGQVPLEWTISETRLKSGRIFTAIVRDLTERLKLETLKSEFISVVGHELRTPLTSIKGSLGVLESKVLGALPDKAAALIAIAYRNTDRLVRLINDILDIEKIESGTLAFEFQPVRTSDLLRQAADANQSYADHFGAAIAVEQGDDGMVMADPDRIMQVLTNLISNAAKFSPRGGVITLAAVSGGDTMHISVTDQGPGIPEQFRARVFEKFAQADSSDSRKLGGTGLGLSISKAIVERHGGRVGFVSPPGEGATFHFELPAWRNEGGCAQGRRDGERPKVLVCDDDRGVRRQLKALISELGFAVKTCATASAAHKLLRREAYAAVTLDLGLPRRGAIGLIGALRQCPETRDLPIIGVSATTEPDEARLTGRAFGIVDWLHPPIDPQRLRASVKRAVEASRQRRPRILHVEDEADHIAIVSRIAGELGDIEAARNCGAARQMLAKRDYDLVILDLMLPDARGESLLSSIYAKGADATPVLIFSVREVPQALLSHVAAALVKTKASNELLMQQIHELLKTGKVRRDIKLFS